MVLEKSRVNTSFPRRRIPRWPLSEMAGDADQAVLLPIPRKGNAIIRLKARLISLEDSGAFLLFEDYRAAEIRGMGLAAARN